MKNKGSYFFFILALCVLCTRAQNETTKWYFGNKAALDFSTNPPTILNNSAMNVFEGCSSIADASGNLLFYTSGDTVWTKTHTVMANGTGLFGNGTPAQGVIIIKKPLSNNLYYIFTVQGFQGSSGTQGLNYSVVDITLAAGMGSVTIKNSPLYNAPCNEEVAATRHCNGQDFWILTHDLNSNTYRAFLLSATGVNTVAVISSLGTTGSMNGSTLKISPTGKKIGTLIPISSSSISVEILDFNNSTGSLFNPLTLSTGNPGGCEFSPDGSKFYTSSGNIIRQWDLCAGSDPAIIASQYTVSTIYTGFVQRAPNGKIYVTTNGFSSLNVINNPNLSGSAMNYMIQAQSLGNGVCKYSLPNFASSDIKEPLNFVQPLGCLTASFTLPSMAAPALSLCTAYGNTVTGINWNFGDPASGPANVSSLNNPVHAYSSYGTYNVQLIINYANCAPDTLRQTIHLLSPILAINSASFTCDGSINATVTPSGGSGQYTYTWMPGNINTSTLANMSPGTYTLNVSDIAGNCANSTTVSLSNPASLTTTTSNTLSCSDATVMANVSGGSGSYTYSWSPGSYTSAANTLAPGVYTLTVHDILNNCAQTQTLNSTTLAAPVLTVSGNFTVCPGQSTTLDVSGADTYTWNATANSTSITLSPTLTSSYTVSGTYTSNSCSSTKTFSISVLKCLGLEDTSEEKEISVYPNPTTDCFIIETSFDIKMKLFNELGTLIMEEHVKKGKQKFDLKKYPQGIYILEMTSKNNIWRERVIREQN